MSITLFHDKLSHPIKYVSRTAAIWWTRAASQQRHWLLLLLSRRRHVQIPISAPLAADVHCENM
jgi:hypothetical protein